ncbi:hypothetical protein AJ87_06900 [Rhizobium yanglingense]|nr:hypothetical protein AJ87_06900 [Rhizobium yanglingense]
MEGNEIDSEERNLTMTVDMADLLDDVYSQKMKKPVRADPTAYKIVSIRLRQAEHECFASQTEAIGVTHKASRIAARRIAGFLAGHAAVINRVHKGETCSQERLEASVPISAAKIAPARQKCRWFPPRATSPKYTTS